MTSQKRKSAPSSGDNQGTGKPKRAKATAPTPTIAELQRDGSVIIRENLRAPSTTKGYDGYLDRTNRDLLKYCQELLSGDPEKLQAEAAALEKHCPRSDSHFVPPTDPAVTVLEYSRALTGEPNRFSPQAVQNMITRKFDHEGLGGSTAESMHAAFKHYWKHVSGDLYRKEWRYNKDTAQWEGNPCNAAIVADLMESIRNKVAERDGRHHARAMTIDCMEAIMTFSQDKVTGEIVDLLNSFPVSKEDRMLLTEFLRAEAFSSTAFLTWPRVDELLKLQKRDCKYVPAGPHNEARYEICYVNRKGWRKRLAKQGRDIPEALHEYNIYDLPDTPLINAYNFLTRWIYWLETHYLGRPLAEDEYIFPHISAAGIVYPSSPMTQTAIQNWIDEAAKGAHIPEIPGFKFTMHCFRRGGAQYRFIHAPVNERWTLARIRWWGGWAEGEHSDTIIKYLLDVLHASEASHKDALSKRSRNLNDGHLGAHDENSCATKGDIRALWTSFHNHTESVSRMHSDLRSDIRAYRCGGHAHAVIQTVDPRTTQYHPVPSSSRPVPSSSSLQGPRSSISHPALSLSTVHNYPVSASVVPIPGQTTYLPHPHDALAHRNQHAQPQHHHRSATVSGPPQSQPDAHFVHTAPGNGDIRIRHYDPHRSRASLSQSQPQPAPLEWHHTTVAVHIPPERPSPNAAGPAMPGVGGILKDVRIPDLNRIPKDQILANVLAQWKEPGYPGLVRPLKDWPREWLRDKDFAAKYSQREIVAREYIDVFRGNDEEFKAQYPEWNRGFKSLMEAIRRARIRRGDAQGRNGKRKAAVTTINGPA